MSTRYWFAVQTRPHQEARAVENLQRQGFDVYLPKITMRKRRRDKWVSVGEALFPGYLFIHADPASNNLGVIRSTLGVRGLVVFGHYLKPVPDEVVNFLRAREDPELGSLKADEVSYQPGDLVEVLDGPFAGLTAVYQMDKPGERALLLVRLLGQNNQISFHLDQLAPLGK